LTDPLTTMSLLGLAIIGRRNEPLYLCDCVRVLREAKEQQQQQQRRRQQRPQRAGSETSSTGGGGASTDTDGMDGAISNVIGEVESSSAANIVQEDSTVLEQRQQPHRGSKEQVQSGAPVLQGDGGDNNTTTTTDDDAKSDNDPFGFKEADDSCDLGQSLSFDQCSHLHSSLDHLEERIESSSAGLPVVTSGRTGHWLGLLSRHGDGDDNHGDDNDDGPHCVYGYITATSVKLLVMVRPPVSKESNVRLFLNGIHDTFLTHSMNPFSSVRPGQRIRSRRFDAGIREAVRDYEDNRTQPQ
jgi:Sedlin, N-terminal conserved region